MGCKGYRTRVYLEQFSMKWRLYIKFNINHGSYTSTALKLIDMFGVLRPAGTGIGMT
ncbi:hypothetical protein CAAN1_01S10352 [[Candida] anglica]|uniref:Uncharacterized protein n=1 Tax=[Candida] anglica TaxID=148631 RepID=A0ABP0EK83_9ASCO